MGLDIGIFLTYVGVILLIFIFGRLFVVPLKVLLKLALNSLLGGIAILVINWIGAGFDLFIPLNMLNAVIVGILGLPGAILLMILN
ncbi:MAG: pro-sigmaK processing inhibitor BofA family protein [Anaerovoracaceae bacterium]|nr:pro-sigmaK processing inhibitor BofA family protein [Anaerovoracaceae bacterium]